MIKTFSSSMLLTEVCVLMYFRYSMCTYVLQIIRVIPALLCSMLLKIIRVTHTSPAQRCFRQSECSWHKALLLGHMLVCGSAQLSELDKALNYKRTFCSDATILPMFCEVLNFHRRSQEDRTVHGSIIWIYLVD